MPPIPRLPRFVALLAAFLLAVGAASAAENILFFGNSFTYAAGASEARKLGGVPKLVEAMAKNRGHEVECTAVTAGGKDLGFHLKQPTTEQVLASKSWALVVLQDYSTKLTHAGSLEESLANGEAFQKRIREHSPAAKIVLYETWARGPGHGIYTGVSTPKTFVDAAEMLGEIQKGYAAMKVRLEKSQPGQPILLARVGTAFALSQQAHPELNLYSEDRYHASNLGYYLSALVIDGTIFHDNPIGAAREFPGLSFDSETAAKLQQSAAEALAR